MLLRQSLLRRRLLLQHLLLQQLQEVLRSLRAHQRLLAQLRLDQPVLASNMIIGRVLEYHRQLVTGNLRQGILARIDDPRAWLWQEDIKYLPPKMLNQRDLK
jgi:hypothetical protein